MLHKRYKTIKNILLDADLDELIKITGIGKASIRHIQIDRLCCLSSSKRQLEERPILATGEQMLDYARHQFRGAKVEIFFVLYLNENRQMIQDEKHAQGTDSHVAGYPKEIFREAVKLRAKFVLLMHNHPNPKVDGALFSSNDVRLTQQTLLELAKGEIELLDHVLFQDGQLFSARHYKLI